MRVTADQQLDLLRAEVARRYPYVRHVKRPSTRYRGEDRYDIVPGNSVFVQAPMTRTGRPRRWGTRWRLKRYRVSNWTYRTHRWQVVRDIGAMAEVASQRSA